MGLLKFDRLPVNTLVGADRETFEAVVRSMEIDAEYCRKFLLTKRVRRLLDPFYDINERRWDGCSATRGRIEAPVFILGHWRSGTTFMHNVISCDDRFGCCSTYQTVFPHLMLWGRSFFKGCMSAVMPSQRPTDAVELGPDLPQEEEFALSNMTPCSYYHFWMFPRRWAEYRRKYLLFDDITQEELRSFRGALDKMIRIALFVSGRQRYLSKNPPHTGRIRVLLEMYPDAKFVYLIRNPYAVFDSTSSFFRNTMRSIRLQSISDAELQEQILRTYVELYDKYEEEKGLIPAGQLTEVRFEDFEADPLGRTQEIYRDLGLGDFERVRPAMAAYLDAHRGFRKNRRVFGAETVRLVETHWERALRQWDYRP